MFRNFLLTAVAFLLVGSGSSRGQDRDKRLFITHHIEVLQREDWETGSDFKASEKRRYNTLMMYWTHFGLNYLKPADPAWHGRPDRDFSRLATTYHHRRGPAGVVLEKFNWFPGPSNTYWADARLPASLAGLGSGTLGSLPAELLVAAWSEPPIGVVGLEVGAYASYARPLQRLDFFEANPFVVEFSQPKEKGQEPFFHFVQDARRRGADVRIFEGPVRPTLAKNAGQGFYQVLILEPYKEGVEVLHEELLTKEGLALCMSKLAPDGILCVHVSNRTYKLAPVVFAAAAELKLAWLMANDSAPEATRYSQSHFSSQWVVIARDARLLHALKEPGGYKQDSERQLMERLGGREPPPGYVENYLKRNAYWTERKASDKHLWTDDGPHSFEGLYMSDPSLARLRYWVRDMETTFAKETYLPRKSMRGHIENVIFGGLRGGVEIMDRVVTHQRNNGQVPDYWD